VVDVQGGAGILACHLAEILGELNQRCLFPVFPASPLWQNPDEMALTPGSRLGPNDVIAPIGAGGTGEVYRARDTRLDRIVALKLSKAQFGERFEREARGVASLNHPATLLRSKQ